MASLCPSRWKILTNRVSVTLTRCSPGSRELENFNRNEAHIEVFWLHEDSGPEASQYGKTHLWLYLAFILFLTGKWKCQHKGALTSLSFLQNWWQGTPGHHPQWWEVAQLAASRGKWEMGVPAAKAKPQQGKPAFSPHGGGALIPFITSIGTELMGQQWHSSVLESRIV